MKYASIENESKNSVYGFEFGKWKVTIEDNQRKDLPLKVAEAIVKQYEFLKIVDTFDDGQPEEVIEETKDLEEINPEPLLKENIEDKLFGKDLIICNICGKEFPTEKGRKLHLVKKHKV